MTSTAQRSFAGGELAPAMYGRADQAKYQSGLRTARNFVVQRHGGAANRAGTKFAIETKTSSGISRLLKFVFSSTQTYVLEVGNGYMRFIQNRAQINVSGVAAYNGATAYVLGDLVLQGGVNYYCILATTGNAPPNATYWYPLTGTVYEIPTPYLAADLFTLQFVQSADTVTIVHPNYQPRQLKRTGTTAWTLVPIVLAPTIAAPTGAAAVGTAGALTFSYKVTAVATDSFEESLPSNIATATPVATPSAGAPITVSWVAVAGATEYNIYRLINGAYGFVGLAQGTAFSDIGYTPDFTANGGSPPAPRSLFAATGDYPSTVTYTQQRLCFGNSNNKPEGIWCSRTASFLNFTSRIPVEADDAIIFSLNGRQANPVRSLLEISGQMVALTGTSEFVLTGDGDGILKPTATNPKAQGYNGATTLQPIPIGNSALFVQARGSVVRDLRYSLDQNGYTGNDLTIFATHLFDGKQIVDWDFAQIPSSVVWAVRNDGTLLGLTYVREQNVAGWHRHDTDGTFEACTVVPEGNEDMLYVVVKRTINGATKRYIERMESRQVTDVAIDAYFVDCGLSFDGRNTTATTMALTLGSGWTVNDTQTLTASGAFFSPTDVGNAIVLQTKDSAGVVTDYVTCTITAYTSATVVTVTPSKNVPAAFQVTATAVWSKAVRGVSGLSHLEGKTVSILADGNVDPQKVVTAGAITFSRPFVVIHVGLPMTAELETLDVENLAGETVLDKTKRPNRVGVLVESSRGIFAGLSGATLYEYKQRATENYGQAVALKTGLAVVPIPGNWQDNARVVIRQTDPLPLTVLALVPSGLIGG